MGVDEFKQTKFFGLLFSLFCFGGYGFLLYQMGSHIAYKKGGKAPFFQLHIRQQNYKVSQHRKI